MERPIASYHWRVSFRMDLGVGSFYWRARYGLSVEMRSQVFFKTIDEAKKDWEKFAKSQCFTWSLEE